MTKTYGKLAARIYELDKPVGCSFGDVEFYLQRLETIAGAVLEPAVGNGRMLIPLAKAGHNVSGFDMSEDMLSLCSTACEKYQVTADLSRQSLTEFDYEQQFAAIVLPAGSFQLLKDTTQAMQFLQRCRKALQHGGKLLLDISVLNGLMDKHPLARHWHDGNDFLVLQEMHTETDFPNQMTTTHLRYELWRDAQLSATELELFSLRWWGLFELELALQKAGFSKITIFGDYSVEPWDSTSVRTFTFEAS